MAKETQVLIRVSPAERLAWKSSASDAGLTFSDWIRKQLPVVDGESALKGDQIVFGYVIRASDSGAYKVGITSNMRSRYSAYRMHSSEGISVVFVGLFQSKDDAAAWEAQLLKQYYRYALHGEWLKDKCPIATEISRGDVGGVPCDEIPSFTSRDSRSGPKTHIIGVRVEDEQHGQFERAAVASGKTVAAWLRDLGAQAVAAPDGLPPDRAYTVKIINGPPIEIPPRPHLENAGHGRRKTASEIAASIPGVSLGVGSPFAQSAQATNIDDWEEAVPSRPWLPELQRLQRQWELEPGEVQENYHALLKQAGGRGAFPVALRNFQPTSNVKEMAARAEYLDASHPLEAK